MGRSVYKVVFIFLSFFSTAWHIFNYFNHNFYSLSILSLQLLDWIFVDAWTMNEFSTFVRIFLWVILIITTTWYDLASVRYGREVLTLFRLAGGDPWDPPWCFLEITRKVLVWGCSNFLTFLTITSPLLQAWSRAFIPIVWILRHTAWMPYFTFTRLNPYLDPLPVIVFRLFIALWKASNKRKQIALFLQRNFAQIFAHMPLKRICIFSVFL